MFIVRTAKFNIGQPVRHRAFDFGGVIVDVDAMFGETEEWFESIPVESRPERDQPFYRVRVDYDGVESIAYVSERNLLADETGMYTSSAERAAEEAARSSHGLMH